MTIGRAILEDSTFSPMEFPTDVEIPRPTYPEVNPGYPGPFLRDPGELDPWEERDIAMIEALRSRIR